MRKSGCGWGVDFARDQFLTVSTKGGADKRLGLIAMVVRKGKHVKLRLPVMRGRQPEEALNLTIQRVLPIL